MLDNHIFGPLKKAFREHWFANDREVKEAVHTWLHTQLELFFADGMRKLVDRSNKCVEKLGDLAER
jgi:hypothetical protein